MAEDPSLPPAGTPGERPPGSPADGRPVDADGRAALPRRRRVGRSLAAAGGLLLVLLAVVVGGLAWSLATAPGTAWLLSVLPGVQATGVRGALLADFQAERVVVGLSDGDQLTLQGAGWRGLDVGRAAPPGLRLRVAVADLHVDRIDLRQSAKPDRPSTPPRAPPTDLRWPVEVEIGSLRIGELAATALGDQPLRDIAARIHIGAGGGAEHRVDGLRVARDRLTARADARITTAAPLDLAVTLDVAQGVAGDAGGAAPGTAPAVAPATTASAPAPAGSSPRVSVPATAPAGRAAVTTPPAAPPTPPTPSLDVFSARATLTGPLAAPTLQATGRAQPAADRPAQALDVRATLRPFAAWPLGDLAATARGLDLAAFASAAPTTALDLDARAASTGLDRPASVAVTVVNTQPGRYDQGRLPLRRLEVELTGRPDDTSTLDLGKLSADFGNRTSAAGRLVGSGRWTRAGWNLDATIDALQPALLDAGAPPMRLSGPVKLTGVTGGVTSATGSGATGSGATGSGATGSGATGSGATGSGATGSGATGSSASSASSASTGTGTGGTDITATEVSFDLAGTLVERGTARQVELQLDGRFDALHLELRRARAAAGAAQATLQGDARRSDRTAPWGLKGRAALVDFDPSTWWPGAEASAWRQGPHRLNARADFDLALPAETAQPVAALLAAVRGQAGVRLDASLLAGVPLSGRADVRSTDGSHAVPSLQLDAAGNTLRAEGRVGLRRPDDQWDLRIAAPVLARLAPLYRLFQPTPAPNAGVEGALQLAGRVTGRWPDVATEGNLDATGLRLGTARVQRAEARWQAGSRADSSVDVQAWLTGAELDGGTAGTTASAGTRSSAASPAGAALALESFSLQLKGTGRAHQLELRAESKALPPAWTEALMAAAPAGSAVGSTVGAALGSPPGSPPTSPVGSPAATAASASGGAAPPPFAAAPAAGAASAAVGPRTLAVLQARGGLVDIGSASPAGWRGSLQQLDLRSSARGAAPLAATRDVGIEAMWAGGPTRVTLQPGRATLLGAGLRWSRIAWAAADAAGVPARIDAQAELEPIPVGPLLARLQPDFGWGGDLAVGGRLNLRSTPTFNADVVLERSRGDLTVTDETGRQSLGLSELRLALTANNGVWNFSQAIAGRTLGTATGALRVRTRPEALWPTPDAPIDGSLQLQVTYLGTWGNWVPAGWRLDGALNASAAVGGRFGAPEYTGRVEGSKLGVRNFLQGVNVTDGELRVALQGTTARIERFDAKAGDGTLRIVGDADLGAAPKARLTVTAERFELLGRVDRRIVASGRANLGFDRDTLALDGGFDVDEGLIDFTRSDAPALGSDVTVMRGTRASAPTLPNAADAPAPASTAAPPPPPTARKAALDLRVTLGEKLRVRGRGLDTGLRGELRVTSPGGKLAVNGSVSTAEGNYQAYGQKLKIDRGVITFVGSTDNPRLDIEATRPDTDDVRVGVAVTGTTLNPRIRLFSQPELSEVDKLSWLVMGRGSESLGRGDTALLQRAALALLSGEGPGKTEQITKAIGLDEISLRQSDGEVRETVISLGKQLSKRWYVGYERGLNATSGNWQLIYRIAQRFTLRAQSGLDNSLDLIWTWRWQ